MKIFSDNYDTLQNEIELIKDSLVKSKYKRLTDNFEMLESFYQIMYEITGEQDEETIEILLKNKKYREIKNRERFVMQRKNNQNFIDNKQMHNAFSGKIINLYDKDFKYYLAKSLYLREEQMCEIICDFLNDEFNQADKFKELIDGDCIFKQELPQEDNSVVIPAGYTIFNYLTNNSFIVISDDKDLRDVHLMSTIVHEFGHVSDNYERKNASFKDNTRYFWLSGYSEVYSMFYEKLFLDYLARNNIFAENAKKGLKNFYLDVFENFNYVEYLSNIDDKLLKNERYKRENNIIEHIQVDENGNLYIDAAILNDLNKVNIYSYGGLLATYFSHLKHNDPEKFNIAFNNFKLKRFGLFNFNIFNDIGTNQDEILKIYDSALSEVTTKKLILQ